MLWNDNAAAAAEVFWVSVTSPTDKILMPARSSNVLLMVTMPPVMVTALLTLRSRICPSSKVNVAEVTEVAPPATTDKEPDLANAPAPPK